MQRRGRAQVLVVTLVAAMACASLGAAAASDTGSAAGYEVGEKSVATLAADLAADRITSEALTRAYLARIARIDASGPSLHSVIALNPRAIEEARAADRRRNERKRTSLLDGIPVLIKDNIESADGTATTAGSAALAANVTRRNAPLVKRLLDAGAVVLGKTNLSEWANARASNSISGWSAVGGLVRNPYALDRNACGSSSGSGAAIAASLAAVGVGTETDGSVTCPSAVNGLVGLKPTVGLVSRSLVIPISHNQDTPGPMGRSVADVAALLTIIAGSDAGDAATKDADAHTRDYTAGLAAASLHGKRLGVLRYADEAAGPAVRAVFAAAVARLKAEGAVIVELSAFKPDPRLSNAEDAVLTTDLKADLNAYLATTPASVKTRTLAQIIAFNRADPRELGLFGQDGFERSQAAKSPSDPRYRHERDLGKRLAGAEGIDRLVTRYRLDALIAPSYGPAWRTDAVDGDNSSGVVSSLPAVAGYPHLTVPMGYVRELPVGISFIGRAWTEASLLQLGAAYERATHVRHAPRYIRSIESTEPVRNLLAPAKPLAVMGSTAPDRPPSGRGRYGRTERA